MNNWTPVVLPLSPNPSPRYNHAAAIFPELDIMIVDGGATERHQQSDKTTFILDMKCPSTPNLAQSSNSSMSMWRVVTG